MASRISFANGAAADQGKIAMATATTMRLPFTSAMGNPMRKPECHGQQLLLGQKGPLSPSSVIITLHAPQIMPYPSTVKAPN